MSHLENTYLKMQKEKKLNLAFIGGSVTEGYGSTCPREKCWPNLVTNWMQETYGIDVHYSNASIGGTASYLNNFRFQKEVVGDHIPDLLFIEFCVNDFYEGYSYETVQRQSESLIGKAYALNPNMDIVYVLTYDLHYETYDYMQLKAHRDMADKYGLLSVKMSEPTYALCKKTGETVHSLYLDWVHPNNRGYEVYAEIIEGVLKKELEASEGAKAPVARKLLTSGDNLLLKAKTLNVSDAKLSDVEGWEYKNEGFSNVGNRYEGHLTASKPGSRFTLEFEGTDLGIFFGADENRGRVKVVVDEKEAVVSEGYLWHQNAKEKPLFSHLSPGKHRAVFTLMDEKSNSSSGNLFEIGCFLVNG